MTCETRPVSHFAEMLPLLAAYVTELEREATATAMGEDPTALPGPRTADLLPDLEQRFDAAVRDAATR